MGIVVANADITALDATSFTAPNMLQNDRWGSNHFSSINAGIFRGTAASSADFWRPAADLNKTTGALSHGGANWSDTTDGDEIFEIWYRGIRPDKEVLDAANRTLEFIPFDSMEALSHLSEFDGSMTASTDTNWTNVGSPGTSAKATTARRVPWGMRAYQLINASANEGTQSTTIPAEEGSLVSAWALSSVNVGTASLVLYDVTNAAAFSSAPTVTHDEEEPMLMRQPWIATPEDCKEIALQLLGTTSTSDIFWNMVWLFKQDDLKINLPSYISEGFKVTAIYSAMPRGANTSNIYQSKDLRLDKLAEGQDYNFIFGQPDANPHAVIFRDYTYFTYPLFLQVRRPYADLVTFSADTDTTTCPIHLFMPRFKIELLDTILLPKAPGNQKLLGLRAKAEAEWRAANFVRPASKPARNTWGGVNML